MFTILPKNDPQLVASYGPQTDDTALLVYEDREENVGHIVMERRGDCFFIIGLSFKDFDLSQAPTPVQRADADALLRAAGSYAVNRAVSVLCCDKEEYFSLLRLFGFKEIDNYLALNLQDLFKVCKNCK